MAGMCLAVSAQESGVDVRVFSAGTKAISRGGSNHAIGSNYQKELGIDYSPETCLNVIRVNQVATQYFCDTRKWAKWINNSAEAMNWQIDIMTEAGLNVSLELPTVDPSGLFSVPAAAHNFWNEENPMGAASGAPLQAQAYADRFLSKGGQIDFSTEAIYLIREDDNKGQVSGVVAKRADGSFVKYQANKAVVLATGDFSHDRDMLARYSPFAYDLFKDLLAFDEPVNYDADLVFNGIMPGTGQKMGLWIGAAWQAIEPCAPMIVGGANGPSFLSGMNFPGINLAADGKRFMNELVPLTYAAIRLMRLPGGKLYNIWDSEYANATNTWAGFGSAVNQANGIPARSSAEEKARWDDAAEQGMGMFKADTIEELVDKLEGLDKANALTSIENWNRYCDQGYDEEFQLNKDVMLPIKTGPFYGAMGSRDAMQFLTVCGGLRTNDDMQVCEADDTPIPGLYNIGIMTGDMYGGEYNFMLPGQNLGSTCLVFPYLLGKDLAKL
jgi:succinate dehydrogenase/fumarate reductase flavoprotein subunit